MFGDDGAVALAVYAPDAFVDALAVEDHAGVLGKELHDVELPADEAQLVAGPGDAAVGVVYDELPVEAELRGCAAAALAAQVGVHARGELFEGEGLDDVVVAAGGEAAELIGLLDAGGEEDDGAGDVLADTAADLEAVEAGHIDVEQDEVGRASGLADGFLAAVGAEYFVAARGEAAGEGVHDVGLVVGYQEFIGHGGASLGGFRPAQSGCLEVFWPAFYKKAGGSRGVGTGRAPQRVVQT